MKLSGLEKKLEWFSIIFLKIHLKFKITREINIEYAIHFQPKLNKLIPSPE